MAEQKIKNILSLDMDILVWECIELYNNNIERAGENAEKQWANLENRMHLTKYLEYDEGMREKLFNILVFLSEKTDPENIRFIKDHDGILSFLCENPIEKGVRFNIYNIDHHHDLFYSTNQKDEAERFNYAGLANWVYYLGCNHLINEYIWINDKYSVDLCQEDRKHLTFPYKKVLLEDFYDSLIKIKFDGIVICKSPDFLAKKFWFLFDNLINIISEKKNLKFDIDIKEYCKEGKSRNIQWLNSNK